jgi:hypothetical protein
LVIAGLALLGLALPGLGAAAGLSPAVPLAPVPGCGLAGGVPVAKPPPPPHGRGAPRAAEEPPATVMHAFYTCTTRPPLPVGHGWVAVGPVRRG